MSRLNCVLNPHCSRHYWSLLKPKLFPSPLLYHTISNLVSSVLTSIIIYDRLPKCSALYSQTAASQWISPASPKSTPSTGSST